MSNKPKDNIIQFPKKKKPQRLKLKSSEEVFAEAEKNIMDAIKTLEKYTKKHDKK
ncbi:hypothetical protein [Cytobacillus sp. IB215665]|uniref:hypothetical protein n=1 Tax=Cytobacillus sp. IB215665 TaxID=3097357 RepID=UPI002A0F3AE7|nr:hypothetical protein [Cytobacillus sp. IB215665]MDX8367707.1 hypothetical protein [Cytobacillus sp. IB215665]